MDRLKSKYISTTLKCLYIRILYNLTFILLQNMFEKKIKQVETLGNFIFMINSYMQEIKSYYALVVYLHCDLNGQSCV